MSVSLKIQTSPDWRRWNMATAQIPTIVPSWIFYDTVSLRTASVEKSHKGLLIEGLGWTSRKTLVTVSLESHRTLLVEWLGVYKSWEVERLRWVWRVTKTLLVEWLECLGGTQGRWFGLRVLKKVCFSKILCVLRFKFCNVWVSERDIRLIVRIFGFKCIFTILKIKDIKDIKKCQKISIRYRRDVEDMSYKTCSLSHFFLSTLWSTSLGSGTPQSWTRSEVSLRVVVGKVVVALVLADPLVVVVASAQAAQLMVVLVLADPLVGRRPLVLVAPVWTVPWFWWPRPSLKGLWFLWIGKSKMCSEWVEQDMLWVNLVILVG